MKPVACCVPCFTKRRQNRKQSKKSLNCNGIIIYCSLLNEVVIADRLIQKCFNQKSINTKLYRICRFRGFLLLQKADGTADADISGAAPTSELNVISPLL
jgi:hypothetical protein